MPPDVPAEFQQLYAQSSEREWLALGVLACEPCVPESAVVALVDADRSFVDGGLNGGWLRTERVAQRPVFGQGFRAERLLSLTASTRTLTLRKLQAEHRLAAVERAARQSLGNSSLAAFSLSLLSGDRLELEAAITRLRRVHDVEARIRWSRGLLRELLVHPFDAAWLEQTWRSMAPLLAEQVLGDALDTLEPVGELYGWLLRQPELAESARRVLAGHALLRGDEVLLERLAPDAEPRLGLALRAARSYLAGDLARALEVVGSATSKPPNAGALAPLVALLVQSRAVNDSARLARRWLRAARPESPLAGWPTTGGNACAARALGILLSNLAKPDGKRARQDVHQLPRGTPVWELVLLALDVQLHEQSEINRASWAKRLHDEAPHWQAAGYTWFAEQARLLTETLSPNSFGATPSTRTLALADLLQPTPEWRKSLHALKGFVATAHKQESSREYRVAWYVDMTTGALTKPALEQFEPGSGWARGRRVDADGLFDKIEQLPPEDAQVLRCATESASGRQLGAEALEALVGHPRVYNGARGRLPVEVVRGECRVETRDEHGHVIVTVEPRAAEVGVNVLIDSESRLRVIRVTPVMARLIALLPTGMRVPAAHAHELLPLLGELGDHVPVTCERLSAHREVPANAVPCLRISAEMGAFSVELGVRPFGERGRFFPAGVGRAALTIHADGHLLSTARDLEREVAAARAVLRDSPTLVRLTELEAEERNLEPALLEPRWIVGEEDLLSILAELREAGASVELEWQNQRPLRAAGRIGMAQLRGKLRPVKGWYLATGGLSFENTEFDLNQLVHAPYTKSGRFIRLPNGGFAEVEKRVRRSLAALAAADAGAHEAGGLKLSALAVDALKVLAENGWEGGEHARAWLARVDAVLAEAPPAPALLEADLRAYQLDGFRFLWRWTELGLGACLADDMGLGKTVQAAGLLVQRQPGGPALVVAPTSVGHNWLAELARFAPSLRVAEYVGKDRARLLATGTPAMDVLVTSYAILQQDSASLAQLVWNTVILDEAQFIKNPHSARAKAAFQLQARARVVLTGTPVENHLGDLWSIFRFLNPDLLGSYKHFFHRFLRPIERDQDAERKQRLKSLVHPFLLRRTKQQVLSDLPPLTVVRHEVMLSHDESLRYALLKKQIHEKLRTVHGKREHKLRILAEITRLRRFCCHPRLVFPDASYDAAKVETLLTLVEELRENGHRALVFSQFVDFLTLIRERLDEQAVSYQYLDGSTPRRQRETSVAAFQRGEGDLFLISLKAGGFGLNLAAADYVIQLDPWWNPAVAAQASDRAHRIGQTRPVTVYQLVTKHTIEESIEQLQVGKRALATELLEGSDGAAKLSADELRELLA
ncbi:MAG TPA: DEAD/DEAH box helicase [Polyangiaceae bacterium]|nr:DEAD/DEAH box helicase [Polyangiaceae bacterium]